MRSLPKSVWDDAKAAAWDDEIALEVESAFTRAAAFPAAEPSAIYEHVFASPTPTISRQRKWHLG